MALNSVTPSQTNKRYAIEVVSDPATRANFDLVSKEIDRLRRDFHTQNYVTSNSTLAAGFSVTSVYPTFTDVVPLTVPIKTTGKTVLLSLAPQVGDGIYQGNIQVACAASTNTIQVYVRFYRDGTIIYESSEGLSDGLGNAVRTLTMSPNRFWHNDQAAASGSHSYKCGIAVGASAQTATFVSVRLWAQEIGGNSLTPG